MNTDQFNSLSSNSRRTYEYILNSICKTKLFSRDLGDITLKYLTPAHCSTLYALWVRGVSIDNANQKARVFSMLMNYCISIGLVEFNPMSRIKKRKHTLILLQIKLLPIKVYLMYTRLMKNITMKSVIVYLAGIC